MMTIMMTTNFSEIKNREEVRVSKSGGRGGEEIRVFGQNIYHCLSVLVSFLFT